MNSMNAQLLALIAALTVGGVTGQSAGAEPLPNRIGQCSLTRVKSVLQRLQSGDTGEDIPDSGSAIKFTNGGYQVSYDEIEAVNSSKPGDQVAICLVELPSNCPAGDNRGKVYKTINLRTVQSWTLSDSEHTCGGR